jgi:uncharacterized protein YcbX
VSELVGRELEPLRFRPNIVIDVPGAVFPEEAWIGRGLQVGDARIRLDVRDERCMVINFDPHTGERAARRRAPSSDLRGGLRVVRGARRDPCGRQRHRGA